MNRSGFPKGPVSLGLLTELSEEFDGASFFTALFFFNGSYRRPERPAPSSSGDAWRIEIIDLAIRPWVKRPLRRHQQQKRDGHAAEASAFCVSKHLERHWQQSPADY